MTDLLQLVFEYRRLVVHRALLSGKLSVANRQRLVGLERLFGQDPEDRSQRHRRRHARCEVRLPATLKMGRHVENVDVVNIGGGGVCVEPAPLLRKGQRASIRVVSLEQGTAYHYRVEAGWARRTGQSAAMGMGFVGTPRREPLTDTRFAEGSTPRPHPGHRSNAN